MLQGWVKHMYCLLDAECGGGMDCLWHVYVYQPPGGEAYFDMVALSGRDVSCFLDSKMQGLPCLAPSTASNEMPPKVIGLCRNIFSATGRYPTGAVQPYFVTQCVFSPSGWVRHHFLGKEICKIKGLSDDIIPLLTSGEISKVCQDI
jgi:hypothetical protein